MMVSASQRADEMGIKNISFLQGDVGDLPFEDNTFDVVVSLNGFHAFPDKEAAFRETYRGLKPGGIFTGCFYVEGLNLHTDNMINRFYIKSGFFTKPFDTITSLEQRLTNLYHDVIVSNVESIAIFQCRKG